MIYHRLELLTGSIYSKKNNVTSIGSKDVSPRQSVSICEFLMVFRKCDIEKILSTAYLPLLFCIISQILTSSIYSEKIGIGNMENKQISH